MQGIAFQGAFFAASPITEQAGLSEQRLLDAIRSQLHHKFGAKGARVVNENLNVVKRGFDEVRPVPHGEVTLSSTNGNGHLREPRLPIILKSTPKSQSPHTDIHRFWEDTGSFYARGMANDTITDPFSGLGTMPAVTSLFRDMTGIRFQHPQWIAENCTACGSCYTVCPDTAIPGLVNEVSQVFDTVVARVRKNESELEYLPGAVRHLERNLREILQDAREQDSVTGMIEEAIGQTVRDSKLDAQAREQLKHEFELFREEIGELSIRPLATVLYSPSRDQCTGRRWTAEHHGQSVQRAKVAWSVSQVCDDDALRLVPQTAESIEAASSQLGPSGKTCRRRPTSTFASITSRKASVRSGNDPAR